MEQTEESTTSTPSEDTPNQQDEVQKPQEQEPQEPQETRETPTETKEEAPPQENTSSSNKPNCRIFLGNLASERTSKEELSRIFGKYGNIEDIVMRRSFGFIQYDNPDSAHKAIEAENGRIIGGMRVGMKLHIVIHL
jgi:RNA recognition motif-containing protein